MKKLLLLLLALNLTVLTTQAQTTSWTNDSGDQVWKETGNWDNGVPDENTVAEIFISPGPIISSQGAAASKLSLNGPGSLLITDDGSLTIGTTPSFISNEATFTVDGANASATFGFTVSMQSNGKVIISNNGNVDINGGVLEVKSGSSVTVNLGTLDIAGDLIVTGTGSTFNHSGGQVTVGAITK